MKKITLSLLFVPVAALFALVLSNPAQAGALDGSKALASYSDNLVYTGNGFSFADDNSVQAISDRRHDRGRHDRYNDRHDRDRRDRYDGRHDGKGHKGKKNVRRGNHGRKDYRNDHRRNDRNHGRRDHDRYDNRRDHRR